ncbi:MAG: metallophosphoesterase [Sphingobacteriales bacterium]|nr:metallophosphoesterase [Sphingobacteriales bacterium]MBI3720776.1 metallophosphoesterase [Sphingobacteriales bacterium]
MRRFFGSWIFLVFMLLLDIYVFQAVRVVTQNTAPKTKFIIHTLYWVVSLGALVILAVWPYIASGNWFRNWKVYLFAIILGIFLAKLIAVLFFLVDDVRRVLVWIYTKVIPQKNDNVDVAELTKGIPRSVFLSWMGIAFGGGLFTSLVYGFGNKYRYQVRKIKLSFDNLPSAFKGFKIVHISDIHSGSFTDKEAVNHGIQKILNEKADAILFTGDLVNNKADEMDEYKEVFKQLNAPHGVFSTFGNHDYGDYVQWETPEHKTQNLEQLKQVHAGMGWRLLNDENVLLEKDGQQIAIIGVQNISGRGNFHSYGNLHKAYTGVEHIPFKILMSHDPSHWSSEVTKKFTDIDLTLSGHTHGMQFGVEIPGLRWSPVKYMYKQWAGLYNESKQKLYVNRGFGFIGYPGRVGILPEITVIELV